MSSSKIRVDPRTFKIINQAQSPAQSPAQSHSQTTTETFTSDQESSTSVNSDTESVKVIKLDSSVQGGGLATAATPQVRVQTQSSFTKPISTSTSTSTSTSKPNLQQTTLTKPMTTSNPAQTLPKEEINKNIFNYLSINSPKLEESRLEITTNNSQNSISDNEEDANTLEQEEEQEKEQEQEQQQSEPQVEDTSQDVFDLTQNKLYQVLSKLFESTKGDGIGENLDKICKLFETHNQIMEKLLNQLIIMNTNHKQVKVPDAFQSSTKQAGNVTEFRKKIDRLDQQAQK